MKIGTFFLATLLLAGTALWARIAIQGVELALLSTVMEWSLNTIRAGTRFLPNTLGKRWSS
ncbi:MAG: hypothetical protein HYV05_11510 [Deltaproteobacteria bacterium]|nr:hypothetical protein [Deltaproteobacteria bacterium]MBI2349262.1 hypothetical protein [Deltaproteobacteria bacterium]